MAIVRLKGIFTVRSKGKVYHYAWRGGPRLPGEKGSPEFIAAYLEEQDKRRRPDPARFKALVTAFRAGPFRTYAVSTQRQWAPWLDRIADHFGDLRTVQFDRTTHIRPLIHRWRNNWRDTPRTADYGLQVLSRLLSFGVSEEFVLRSNACEGIARLYTSDRADIIWTDADLEALKAAASPAIYAAARLAALTGLRQGDLLRLPWSAVGAYAIEFKTSKRKRRVTIPLYDDLESALAELPRKGPLVLVNSSGRPWRTGFSSSWNKAMKASGLMADERGLHFHDLRGTAATRLYLADFSIREIAEMMGWSEKRVEQLIDRYVKRDEILQDRIRRLSGRNTQRTENSKTNSKTGSRKSAK